MGKTIKANDPTSKKYIKRKKKSDHINNLDHLEKYRKKQEKAEYPRRVWPTDQERHKGPRK